MQERMTIIEKVCCFPWSCVSSCLAGITMAKQEVRAGQCHSDTLWSITCNGCVLFIKH